MEDESLVILFKTFIFRLREPVLISRFVQQIFDLSIELRIIDGNKLDGIGMKTKETTITCRVVKHFLQKKPYEENFANGVHKADGN